MVTDMSYQIFDKVNVLFILNMQVWQIFILRS